MCLGKNTNNKAYSFIILKWKRVCEEKTLGIIIDNKLKFKRHVKNLCKKASQKIWTWSCLTNYLNDSKKN